MAQFSKPETVRTVVETMRQADQPRAGRRALINDLFNGLPPFTDAEANSLKVQHNFNSLEGPNIMSSARQQLYNALLKTGNYFAVKYDKGPPHLRIPKGSVLTNEINRVMKKSLPFVEAARSTHAQICLHGIGPRLFENKSKWCPSARGIEDVLVPSGTLVSLENLDHFAVFQQFTAAQLYRATHGTRVDPGWNKRLVERIVASLLKEPAMAMNYSDWRFPEKLAENIKSDYGYYASDAIPTINSWNFYFRGDDGKKWHKKILIDSYNPTSGSEATLGSVLNEAKDGFIYDPKGRVEAKELSEIMHVQFADCSNVAPFRWHSVRSLGYLLYNVCRVQNMIRCRLSDAMVIELLWFFKNVPEEDREKLLSVQLYNMGIIPQGVDFVTGPERYKPDANFVSLGLSQNRQLMAENSASFVQDVAREQGNSDETATLTMAKINNANALIGGMLNLAYIYETSLYYEVARRFCESSDPDCVEFRKRCQEQGLEKECFDVKAWEIKPERVLGAGNKTLEIAQADRLMAARGAYDPAAQRVILHLYTEANADPGLAEQLVPLETDELETSKAEHEASLAMGTLMLGLHVPIPRNVAINEYAEVLLFQLWTLVTGIEQSEGMVDMLQLKGLVNVDRHVEALIAHLEQDETEQERVRAMKDKLGEVQNLIKAFAQRLQEQQQASQMDPETMAKVQAIMMTAQAKIQAGQATTAQKLQQKDAAFRQKFVQSEAKTRQQLGMKAQQAMADAQRVGLEMSEEQAKHTHQLLMDQEAHEAEMKRQEELAEAEASKKRNGDKE